MTKENALLNEILVMKLRVAVEIHVLTSVSFNDLVFAFIQEERKCVLSGRTSSPKGIVRFW